MTDHSEFGKKKSSVKTATYIKFIATNFVV